MTLTEPPARTELPGTTVPHASIVVPTFNEAENIGELLTRIGTALGSVRSGGAESGVRYGEAESDGVEPHEAAAGFEVLFVDDSTDDTPQVIERAAAQHGFPVRLIHRPSPENGLGGAVLEGIRAAHAPYVVVMDADLQHPPEAIPALLAAARSGDQDLVVASRYAGGGSAEGLSDRYRTLVSRGSTRLAKVLFRRRLAGITDPMSGFFAIRRSLVHGRALYPSGYKILLELAVRCAPSRIGEVPFSFQPRFAGESKASLREGWRFLRHVAMLRFDAVHARLIAFGLIGLSGFVPNLVVLNLLLHHTRIGVLLGEVLANQVAIVWNFALLDLVLFRHRRSRHWSGRIGAFLLLANVDLVLRIPLLAVLVKYAHLGSLTATVLTLIAAFGLRFLVADRAIYMPVKALLPHGEQAADAGAAL